MKIGISGSSGHLGKVLHEVLVSEHLVTTLGRSADCNVFLDLELPGIPALDGIEALVHCAWPMHRRQAVTQRLAASSSIGLLSEAMRIDIPFIFISSVTADVESPSNYASSKALVEECVLAYSKGLVLRVGNLTEATSRLARNHFSFLGIRVRPYFVPDIPISIASSSDVARAVVESLNLRSVGLDSSFNQDSSLSQLIQQFSPGTRGVPVPCRAVDVLTHLLPAWSDSSSLVTDSWRAMRFAANLETTR